jgi:geranylgeranyl pyrophosphate synthase
MNIKSYLQQCQKRVYRCLNQLLPTVRREPCALHKAMRYAVLSNGKRLRPTLIYATGEALNAQPKVLDHIAAAIEMIHVFSLIHDDLPALDNDSLRRGMPACHIAFGESTAILAGDALQTRAFEILANLDMQHIPPTTKLEMIKIVAHAVGSLGLIGGEVLDIAMENKIVTLDKLKTTYQLKTGALFTTSILLGALGANCHRKKVLDNLKYFSEYIGLAFQIHDDIIGIESETATLGKPQGSDAVRNKPTYPAIVGLVQAKKKTEFYYKKSLFYLDKTGIDTTKLEAVAQYIIHRHH